MVPLKGFKYELDIHLLDEGFKGIVVNLACKGLLENTSTVLLIKKLTIHKITNQKKLFTDIFFVT